MIACHFCPDHRKWDEQDIMYFVFAGGGATRDPKTGFLTLHAGLSKEPVPSGVAICPNCLKNMETRTTEE
jgi:hypothetical protein